MTSFGQKRVVLLGSFRHQTQAGYARILRSHGAIICAKGCESARPDLAIVGRRPGKAYQRILEQEIPVLNEEQLRTFVLGESQGEDRFNALRELLLEPPSAELWFRLCSFFDFWDEDDELEVGLAYAMEHLKSWPHSLRKAPAHWFAELRRGFVEPRIALVSSLTLLTHEQLSWCIEALPPSIKCLWLMEGAGRGRDEAHKDLLRRLFRSPLLEGLEELHLPEQRLDDDLLDELLAASWPQLKILDLERNPISYAGFLRLQEASLPQLERLELGFCPALPSTLADIEAPGSPNFDAMGWTQDLSETSWHVITDTDEYIMTFRRGGQVTFSFVHSADDDEEDFNFYNDENDVWSLEDGQLRISLTNGFATWKGAVDGYEASGVGENINEYTWDWRAELVRQPERYSLHFLELQQLRLEVARRESHLASG